MTEQVETEVVTEQPQTHGTPSTASRVRPVPVENAFPTPTPPRREQSRRSENVQEGRQSPAFGSWKMPGKSSLAPKAQPSIEAIRSDVSRTEIDNILQKKEVSKKTSLYFDQFFATREPYHSARERVTRESVIVVELCINAFACVDIESDDDTSGGLHNNLTPSLINDFMMIVSETYHKPPSHIFIASTSANIVTAGTSGLAYLLKVTALSSEIAATKNMRATFRFQDFFLTNMNIPPTRGVIRFQEVGENNLATNGTTLQGEIERLEMEEKRTRNLASRQSNKVSKRSTMANLSELHNQLEQSRSDSPLITSDSMDSEVDIKPHRVTLPAVRAMRTKRSIMSFWKRSSTNGTGESR